MRVYPVEKKIPPFPHLLFIYLFIFLLLLPIGSVSQPLLPGCPRPYVRLREGRGVVGVWVVVVVGGVAHVGRQAEQNQSNAQ